MFRLFVIISFNFLLNLFTLQNNFTISEGGSFNFPFFSENFSVFESFTGGGKHGQLPESEYNIYF